MNACKLATSPITSPPGEDAYTPWVWLDDIDRTKIRSITRHFDISLTQDLDPTEDIIVYTDGSGFQGRFGSGSIIFSQETTELAEPLPGYASVFVNGTREKYLIQ